MILIDYRSDWIVKSDYRLDWQLISIGLATLIQIDARDLVSTASQGYSGM